MDVKNSDLYRMKVKCIDFCLICHNFYFYCVFQNIVAYPPTKQLTSEETDLVWKFRYYLSSQKKVNKNLIQDFVEIKL